MTESAHRKAWLRWTTIPVWSIVATVVLLTMGAVCWATLHLRERIRTQIINRDAVAMHTVARMQQISQGAEGGLGDEIEDPLDQLLIALQISQLREVVAARLFDTEGRLVGAFPTNVAPAEIARPDLGELRRLNPVGYFHPRAPLESIFMGDRSRELSGAVAPLLEVLVPLHGENRNRLLGVVQFYMSGVGVLAEFAGLDRHLFRQAFLIATCSAVLLGITVGWSFHRLQRANLQLVERTTRLVRANNELAAAAKTSAVGAVASHLIHGLSNPISGLHEFVATRGGNPNGNSPDADWNEATSTTRRMLHLIHEVTRVIKEERHFPKYEVSLGELADTLRHRAEPQALDRGVRFHISVTGEADLDNRGANLAMLILENLIHNAFQASQSGKAVRVALVAKAEAIQFEVADQGCGISDAVRERLFTPCPSTKPGGAGIGLAICKQLAAHLGADLHLKATGPQGTVFTLHLPHPAASQHAGTPPSTATS